MKLKSNLLILITLIILIASFYSCSNAQKNEYKAEWPATSNITQPWTRWWWHGSAVNKIELTANMEELKKAGLGGVEITPIYGVKGYESEDISFLSSEWMDVFSHTLKEGKRLELGIDIANASGWPFGGPWISSEDACKNVQYKIYELKDGNRLNERIKFIQKPLVRTVGHKVDISEVKYPISSNTNLQELALDQVRFEKKIPLQSLMAYNDKNDILDLTNKVDEEGNLDWTAPEGNWKLYAVFQGWHGKMVERAGKGGEGNVIDHFSEKAAKNFLDVFDQNAKDVDLDGIRAFFNDSYEVDDASGESNWTTLFFDEFQKLRGYDLKNHLPALFGNDSEEINNRVICDYRETISDLLLLRFTKVWSDWSKKYNAGIRNQAHGSPANILDLYAASDIPETEGITPMRIKMATSAGHVSGKPLIACEAATWLDEHFLSNLADVKQNVDRYFTHGVNHIVYHGTPYSPQDEKWPGWLFYASTHFAPTNTWWEDFKTINSYVTNVQSFLQNSKPANDILLYFPIYHKWSKLGKNLLHHFGHKQEDLTQELSESLLEKGYTFDYISDKQIQNLEVKNNKLNSNGAEYKTIVVPYCHYIPLETIEKIVALSNAGANVILENGFPKSISGLHNISEKEKKYKELKENNSSSNNEKLVLSDNVLSALNKVNVFHESMSEDGLSFNKVIRDEGVCYFINNWSDTKVDKYIELNSSDIDAVIFNPINKKYGKAKIRKKTTDKSEVYLQLEKGESLILQFYSNKQQLDDYPVYSEGQSEVLEDDWQVEFISGGPKLPESISIGDLQSWPEISKDLESFSGTAKYTTTFNFSSENIKDYLLDLGEVYESAVVILNGEKIETLVGPVFKVKLDSSKLQETNSLEILVTNLMANRIIDMENNGEEYRNFYNINFSARLRENYINGVFSAKHWDPQISGLIGPVKLIELN